MSNNPPKPPPHILAAGNEILRNLDITQKANDDLFNKNGALKFDKDVPANILQAIPISQPMTRGRLHFTPPQLGGPHFPGLSQSTNLDTKEPFHQSHQNNPLAGSTPKPPAGRSPQSLRKLPPRECKSKYKMLIRQHQAKVQLKKEKKKLGYKISTVARVHSATVFISDGQNSHIIVNARQSPQHEHHYGFEYTLKNTNLGSLQYDCKFLQSNTCNVKLHFYFLSGGMFCIKNPVVSGSHTCKCCVQSGVSLESYDWDGHPKEEVVRKDDEVMSTDVTIEMTLKTQESACTRLTTKPKMIWRDVRAWADATYPL
jgi:hypothetical protein